MPAIKCGHCGNEHDDTTKFCPTTGKALGRAAGARATMLMFQAPGTKLPGSSAPATPDPAAAAPRTATPAAGSPETHAARTVANTKTMIGSPDSSGLGIPGALPRGSTPSSGVPLPLATGSSSAVPVPRASAPSGGVSAPLDAPPSGTSRIATPSGGIPASARGSTPATGITGTGSRPIRLTPIAVRSTPTEVPPPPVASDGVPPPPVSPAVDAVPTEVSGANSDATSGPRRAKSMPDWVVSPQHTGAGPIPSAVFPAVASPPKGVIDLLKEAFGIYKQHLRVFVVTAAILFVPASLVTSGLLALITAPLAVSGASVEAMSKRLEARSQHLDKELSDRLANGKMTPAEVAEATRRMTADGVEAGALAGAAMGTVMAVLIGMLAWAVVAFLIYGLVVPLTTGALTVAVADRLLGGDATWRDHWRWLFLRLGKLVSALLPAALLVTVGFFFFVIPGMILSFCFVFVPVVVLVEGKAGVEALKRSFALVKSDWLRVAVVLIAFGIINFVAHVIASILIPHRAYFFNHVVGDVITLVLMPIPVLAVVLLYFDLRRKNEGVSREALHADLEGLRLPT